MKALRCGEASWTVEVRRVAGRLQVLVGDELFEPELRSIGPGCFVWRSGSGTETLHCVRDGGVVHLHWRGEVYRLEEQGPGPPRGARPASGALEAPMPGTVIKIAVAPGDEVSRGQELLVVEAMKMENALRAPRAGVVRAIHAQVGEMVGPGRTLVELELPEEAS